MLKFLLVISLLLSGLSSFASTPENEICGLINFDKSESPAFRSYYLSFGSSPEDQHKLLLVAQTPQAAEYLSKAYNNSQACVIGTADGEGRLLADEINYEPAGLPRTGRSN